MVIRISAENFKTDQEYRPDPEADRGTLRRPQRRGKGKGTEIAGKP